MKSHLEGELHGGLASEEDLERLSRLSAGRDRDLRGHLLSRDECKKERGGRESSQGLG